MSSNWGTNIELSIFGESHGKAIGVNIGHLPSGIKIDFDEVKNEMKRRMPGQNSVSTTRVEADEVEIMSGILDGVTTGAPLLALIYNSDQHSKDYSYLKEKMRPGHSDYPAFIKYKGMNDVRGGGHFSGRLTAPLVFAGSIAKQILAQKDIYIGAHILSVYDIKDDHFPVDITRGELDQLKRELYPTLKENLFEDMKKSIENAKKEKTSLGGKIECAVINLPAGLGDPFFDSIESHLAPLLFSIPAVKSVSFGLADDITSMKGHMSNDQYYFEDNKVKTQTNYNGGVLGGITTGMPLVVTVGIKPTPSISSIQNTINVQTNENTELEIKGRHDPCIVPRAVVVVESMIALGLLDLINK